ncbi:MAG: hypothetical protein HYV04_19020 [Deltaproteobacteria bacterium]|nr:hypothetical protein [Deltaproteobacteria bacterium]
MKKSAEGMVIEAGAVRIEIAYRRRGTDKGLSFEVYGPDGEDSELLRFDCFEKRPHYHLIKDSGMGKIARLSKETAPDPVRWTLDRLKRDLATLLWKAGHRKLSREVGQQAVARALSKAEKAILRLARG